MFDNSTNTICPRCNQPINSGPDTTFILSAPITPIQDLKTYLELDVENDSLWTNIHSTCATPAELHYT